MKLWEYRIKQYTYNLETKNIQKRSRQNYEVEEILSDFGKEGYELVNVITEPLLDEKYNNNGEFNKLAPEKVSSAKMINKRKQQMMSGYINGMT